MAVICPDISSTDLISNGIFGRRCNYDMLLYRIVDPGRILVITPFLF